MQPATINSFDLSFPTIYKTAEMMTRDNGGINRFRSIESFSSDLYTFCEPISKPLLQTFEDWLVNLSEDDMETVAFGEHEEMQALMTTAPEGLDDFLEMIFENVV